MPNWKFNPSVSEPFHRGTAAVYAAKSAGVIRYVQLMGNGSDPGTNADVSAEFPPTRMLGPMMPAQGYTSRRRRKDTHTMFTKTFRRCLQVVHEVHPRWTNIRSSQRKCEPKYHRSGGEEGQKSIVASAVHQNHKEQSFCTHVGMTPDTSMENETKSGLKALDASVLVSWTATVSAVARKHRRASRTRFNMKLFDLLQ